ncbi:hypothetical protein EUA66_03150 [TM7 phylum sp. oral taxon 349]|nr:hypothetical protein EUA66_03150 [TM7 phylum sp. oral taxon 349]
MMRIAQLVNQYNPDLVDVTICGSMAHQEKFAAVARTLKAVGLRVRVPAAEKDINWSSLAEDQALAKKKDYMDGTLRILCALVRYWCVIMRKITNLAISVQIR